MQQEQREMRRKNHNPFDVPPEKQKVSQVFKLRGYTDSTQLTFSDLAACKMSCLSLNESNIRQVLKEGNVNIKRSEIALPEKTFVVESGDSRRINVIVIPKGYTLFVVTVNQMDSKFTCTCK